jgi:hypothetical protein
MGRTACTEPQCLYKGALYFFYQPTNKIVKDEKGELVTDTHSILARRRRKHFSQFFNVHAVKEVG